MSADIKKWCQQTLAQAKEMLGRGNGARKEINRLSIEIDRLLREPLKKEGKE